MVSSTPRLFDKHRSAQAVIDFAGIDASDISAFCDEMGFSFYSVGVPGDWDNRQLFRAATPEFPARGVTVLFETVLEWKRARQLIGERILEGQAYRHYSGELHTTMCGAEDDKSGAATVVYQTDSGKVLTALQDDFFGLLRKDGSITPVHTIVKPS